MPRELKTEQVIGHGGWRGVYSSLYRQDLGVGEDGGFRLRGWSKLETPLKLTGSGCFGEHGTVQGGTERSSKKVGQGVSSKSCMDLEHHR